MIQLHAPQVLFGKQKVLHVSRNVEKKISETVSSGSYRAVFIYNFEKEQLLDPFKDMLTKLAGACKLKPDETLFINCFSHPVSIGQLQGQYSPELILIFGDMPASRNISRLKKHYPYNISGAVVIKTETIENLELIKGEKAKLWSVLQQALKLK
ncbi:MAG: hypothetical protein U0T74_11250 [Chitinophagales bacterium]